MVGQSCDHGGRTRGPVAIGHSDAECSYRPAEIASGHREIGYCLVNWPKALGSKGFGRFLCMPVSMGGQRA